MSILVARCRHLINELCQPVPSNILPVPIAWRDGNTDHGLDHTLTRVVPTPSLARLWGKVVRWLLLRGKGINLSSRPSSGVFAAILT